MNLKSFLIASLIIHIIGAIVLYFYYNPITFAPKPVEIIGEEQDLEEELKLSPKKSKPKKFFSNKQKKSARKKALTKVRKKTKAVSIKKKLDPILTQQALSDAKDPSPKKQESFTETTDSPTAVELQELKEDETEVVDVNLDEKIANSEVVDVNLDDKIANSKVVDVNLDDKIANSEVVDVNLDDKSDNSKVVDVNLDDKSNNPDARADLKLEELEEVEEAEEEPVDFVESKAPSQEVKNSYPDDKKDSSSKLKDKLDLEKTEIDSKTLNENYEELEEENPESSIKEDNSRTEQIQENQVQEEDNSIKTFTSLKQKLGNPPLSYPDFARREGIQGEVSILFFVTEQGLVDKIQLESSSGHSELDNFVLRTIARYEFLPNQETWVRYKIPFILKGEEEELLRLRQE